MAFAGLWERWRPDEDQVVDSCVIITTNAAPGLETIHERMPVVLPPDTQTVWLADGATPEDCLGALRSTIAEGLDIRPVERTVNNPSNEGAELIRPAADHRA